MHIASTNRPLDILSTCDNGFNAKQTPNDNEVPSKCEKKN